MSDIDQLRNKMDEITLEMIKLLKNRMEVSKQIGAIKKEKGLSVTDEDRERSLRTKVLSLCKELGINETSGARFLNFLLNESVKVHHLRNKLIFQFF